MKWALEAVGHWWTLGKCCSWWTLNSRGPEVSEPLPASGEEVAGCKQWRGLDCKRSSRPLIERERDGKGRREGSLSEETTREESERGFKHSSHIRLHIRVFGRADRILISRENALQTHFKCIILSFKSAE